MKIKFLSLFLALSIFAVGTSVMAEEKTSPEITPVKTEERTSESGVGESKQAPLGDISGTLLCAALNEYIPVTSSWPQVCQDACAAASPSITDMGCCVKQMVLANNSSHPNVQSAVSAVKTACGSTLSPVCSGKTLGINGTCSVQAVRQVCGYVCCNIDPTTVTNCMTSYGDTCSNYTSVTCPSAPPSPSLKEEAGPAKKEGGTW